MVKKIMIFSSCLFLHGRTLSLYLNFQTVMIALRKFSISQGKKIKVGKSPPRLSEESLSFYGDKIRKKRDFIRV
jgi:hypothetical protein